MRLADKRTIQTVMAGQRKSQIDEGVAIARKVDALREIYSSLQAQQQLFIDSMSTALTKRTEELKNEIADKELIIVKLEQKRLKLMEPFTIKWEEVRSAEEQITKHRKALNLKDKELLEIQQELNKRERSIVLEEEKLEDLKQQINLQVEKVCESSLEAQNTLLNARKIESDTLALLKKEKGKITQKETELKIRESNVKIREKQLEIEEKEIINTKLRLADQRATLERAIARHK